MHILVVEDDSSVAGALQSALQRHAMTITWLSRGRDVIDHLSGVDVVLLDLGLPDVEGISVCRAIREVSQVTLIVASARGEVDDRILGLRSGADDYLVKPYDVGELIARLHAVYRRRRNCSISGTAPPPETVIAGDMHIDLRRHTVTVGEQSLKLTPKEFQVLALLASSGGAVCTRSRILTEVWGRSSPGANRTLEVHMTTLRAKLGRTNLVQTVRGVGYRLRLPTEST